MKRVYGLFLSIFRMCSVALLLSAPSLANAQACANSNQCATNLCFNGQCAPTKPDGQSCGSYLECSSQNCFNNVCRRTSTNGGACSTGNQCATGTCFNGSCSSAKPDGSSCNVFQECQSKNCANGACGELKADGGSCSTANECSSKNCVNSRCSARLGALGPQPTRPGTATVACDPNDPFSDCPSPGPARLKPAPPPVGPDGLPKCMGDACEQVTLARVNGCLHVTSSNRAYGDIRWQVEPFNRSVILVGETFVLRTNNFTPVETCIADQPTRFIANYIRPQDKVRGQERCKGPGTCTGSVTITHMEKDATIQSDWVASPPGASWSRWVSQCTALIAEGWKIVSHKVRTSGDRTRTCGGWMNCEKIVETPRLVCYRFQSQGHNEGGTWQDVALHIDYRLVYDKP